MSLDSAIHTPSLADVDREYLNEKSSTHMTTMATEARTEGITKWITERVDPRRKNKPPKEARRLRKELRRERKVLAGRHYQLPSGHTAIGNCFCDRIRGLPSNRRWCGTYERQCGKTSESFAGGNIPGPRRSPCCSTTNGPQQRCCPSFET